MQSPDTNARTQQNTKTALDARGMTIALVVSTFNAEVTDRLLQGAETRLERSGCPAERRVVVRVPGSWELPLAAARLAANGSYDAIVALGCLIRGETSHYDVLADAAAAGLQRVALDHGIPVIFGVLTTENSEQALDRAGGKYGNKGDEAAATAIEMVDVYRRLT